MKNITNYLSSIAIALSLGALNLRAQSPAPLTHAAAASGEASAAVGGSAESAIRAGSVVIAVPLWVSGGLAQGSGTVAKASGAASLEVGKGATQGANEIWDFATGDPAARPALNRSVGIPPAKRTPPKDPTPAEALRQKM